MAVIRINKTADYTVMSNAHFKEKDMSLKAKGLLSLMLSLPDGWDYSIAGLVTLSKDGKDGVMSALNELEEFRYLKRTILTKDNGQFDGYDYDIFEKPYAEDPKEEKPYSDFPNTDYPYSDYPYSENPNTDNPPQLNTNQSSTNQSSTNQSSNKGKEEKRKRFVPPSLDEVKAYCIERQNNVDPQRFIDYYTANGWKVGKNSMKDWKASVRTWEKNDFNSNNKNAGKKFGATGIEIVTPAVDDLADVF